VDWIEDKDIGTLWAEHYPKRMDDVKSKTVCLAVCLIVEQKAARNASADAEDLFDYIHRSLVALGIPKDQFYNVEKESGEI